MKAKATSEACCTPPKLAKGKLAFDKELARLCKALGHPIRVRIVQLLLNRKTCVCGDIVSELPLAQSTVSQHLKVLKEAGVIYGEVEGPAVCYCVHPAAIEHLKELLSNL